MSLLKKNWMGVFLCLGIAIPSWFLGALLPLIGGPIFGILLGMTMAPLIKNKARLKSGISFTSKKILQLAVILLGFGMNLSTILSVGRQSLPLILSTITAALLIAYLLFRVLKLPRTISILIGVGSSICGGSAIAATAPVIGADDEEIAQSISVIFLFNVIAALIFPTLGAALGLSNEGFALFAGTAINDTSSVTAAAAAWDGIHGSNTLALATVVKLTRTLAIIPITLALAFLQAKYHQDAAGEKVNIKKIFPFFILFFVLASVITTAAAALGVSQSLFAPIKNLSKFLIVMAMSAIGLNSNIVKLVKSGGKPILLGFSCWAGIICMSLAMHRLLGLW